MQHAGGRCSEKAAARSVLAAAAWLCLAGLAACVTPPTEPPPSVPPAPRTVEHPPPAEEAEAYALVRDDPAVAGLTAELAAALPASRPSVLLRRAREARDAARRVNAETGGPFRLGAWPPERARFIAYVQLALRDLEEILVKHPRSPEAAEAAFTVGQVNDYPYLNRFDAALEAYRLASERYPGTPWARQAAERAQVIERYLEAAKGSPHGGAATPPAPAR